jgi:hypothetical protein
MKNKIITLALSATLFALCSSAQAQQSGKVPRIGYLAVPFLLSRNAPRHFGKVYAILGMRRVKISSLNGDLPREIQIECPRLRLNLCS